MTESMSQSGDSVKTERVCEDRTRIRRPPNAFMIFGQKFRKQLANDYKKLSNKEISKLLGEEWRRMDSQTKNEFHKMADEAHRIHLQKYPGYYYSPLEARQRKAERKRKPKVSTNDYNSANSQQITHSTVRPMIGNNMPILIRNPMFPMMRPMFPFPPRMAFGQQFHPFPPNCQFGGPSTQPYP